MPRTWARSLIEIGTPASEPALPARYAASAARAAQCAIGVDVEEGAQPRVQPLDPRQDGFRDFDRAERPGAVARQQFGGAGEAEVGRHYGGHANPPIRGHER